MTELLEAVKDVRQEPDRRLRLRAAMYTAHKAGKPQTDLIATTGYTREQVRRLIQDERIELGEIEPTPRYLRGHATKQAAKLLDMTRQQAAKLLEAGEIPFCQEGRYRRITVESFLIYRRRQAADELTRLGQQLDLP